MISPINSRLFRRCSRHLLLVVVLLCPLAFCHAQNPIVEVVVSRVIEAEVNAGRRVVGTVNPLKSSTIGSAVDGRVVEFLIEHGDPVKKRQPLARLRTETLEIERAAAQAELELYHQQLAELQNGSRPEDVEEARARMLGAKAAKAIADSKLRRLNSLSASRVVSEADIDDARERAEFTRFALSAAEALLKRIEEGPRIERIAQAKAQVDLRNQRIRLIDDRIVKHTIVAPFDGFVAAEFTEVGAWVTRGDPIAQVIRLDEVEIEAPTTAEYAVQLRRGDTIRVEFPELPERLFTGNISRVVPMADSRARTFPVYVRMANEIHDSIPLLMAGMLARVELPTGARRTLPLVPKDALVLNEADRAVFVIELDSAKNKTTGALAPRTGTARKVAVELGVAAGSFIQIKGPLRHGDLVVSVGNERLRDQDRVTIVRVVDGEQPTLESDLQSVSNRSREVQ